MVKCPNCGNEISKEYTLGHNFKLETIKCKECGYGGPFPTAKNDELVKIKKINKGQAIEW